MSYAEALARVTELQTRFGFGISSTTLIDTGTFDEVLQSAQSNFNRGPTRLNPLSGDFDQGYAQEALANANAPAATRSLEGGRSSAATRGLTPEVNAMIQRIARKHGVPAALVKAVARAESGFKSDAVSPAGAQGMMQLMPATGKGLGVSDPFNAEQSIEGGTRYLKNALRMFNGDVRLALAAYNAGPNAVKKYDGIPPYAETQNYVKKVMQYAADFGLRGSRISL